MFVFGLGLIVTQVLGLALVLVIIDLRFGLETLECFTPKACKNVKLIDSLVLRNTSQTVHIFSKLIYLRLDVTFSTFV